MVANELARHGVPPRIIDRAPAPATTSRALVVQPRTLEIFDDIGVIDQAIAAGDSASGLTITFATKAVELDFAGQLTGPQNYTAYPEPRTLSQHDTERHSDRAVERAGRRDRARAGTDGSDPGRRDGDRVVARRGWLDRDRALPVGHRLRRRAQCGAQGGRHPVQPGPPTATSSSWPTPNSTGSCRTADFTDSPVLQAFSRPSRCRARIATGSSATSRRDPMAPARSTANPATKSSRRWSMREFPSLPRSSRSTG